MLCRNVSLLPFHSTKGPKEAVGFCPRFLLVYDGPRPDARLAQIEDQCELASMSPQCLRHSIKVVPLLLPLCSSAFMMHERGLYWETQGQRHQNYNRVEPVSSAMRAKQFFTLPYSLEALAWGSDRGIIRLEVFTAFMRSVLRLCLVVWLFRALSQYLRTSPSHCPRLLGQSEVFCLLMSFSNLWSCPPTSQMDGYGGSGCISI